MEAKLYSEILEEFANAPTRAEKLAVRSLDITREAIAEAEYRLAKLPSQQNSIESFLEETRSMLTPEQEVIIARRKSLEQAVQQPLEAEVIDDSTQIISEVDDK